MDLGLKNKFAFISGGSHGIGRAIAISLAREGCNVAICSRSQERLDQTRSELDTFGVEVLSLQADVLRREEVESTVSEIKSAWGALDILINNVGGGGRWGKEDMLETDDLVWQEVYDKNVTAAVHFTKGFLPYMLEKKWGRVVTITSKLGLHGGGRPWFNIAKTAQTVLMKNLALNSNYVRRGVTFNSVAPGCIMIPNTGWEDEMKKDPVGFKKMLDRDFPLGRMGTPEEVADTVTFLSSTKSSLVNGASILVDGGESVIF